MDLFHLTMKFISPGITSNFSKHIFTRCPIKPNLSSLKLSRFLVFNSADNSEKGKQRSGRQMKRDVNETLTPVYVDYKIWENEFSSTCFSQQGLKIFIPDRFSFTVEFRARSSIYRQIKILSRFIHSIIYLMKTNNHKKQKKNSSNSNFLLFCSLLDLIRPSASEKQ